MRKTTSAGFTLIELLVVIAIIGLLSSVVLASLNGARKKSRDARRIADLNSIRTAIEIYFDDNKRYPDCLYSGNNDTGSACGAVILEGSNAMPVVPKDPLTGLQYSYAYISPIVAAAHCATTPYWYHLGASLEVRTNTALLTDSDGTDTDVANTGRCNGTTNYDFYGLSAAAGGQKCSNATDGTTGTETCFDLRP